MPPTSEPRPLRVLVGEDNPVNQRLVRAVLKHRGHSCVVASGGREVLAALDAAAFDIVLMDLHMPEMDGVEAAGAIRAREAATGGHIPILALTASAGDGDEERCLAVGMDGYITKPIRAEELIERIERAAGMGAGPATAGAGEGPRRRLTGLFVADAARLCGEIHDAVARRDAAALQAAAHRLRGSAGYFAAQRAFELAVHLERHGRESVFNADTERLCRELGEELARLDGEMKAV